ncbi:hypothetical protein ACLOJK_036522 [Asimina triloba]
MGARFSSTEPGSSYYPLTATVISVNGALRQYPLSINASQVLGLETTSPSSFFLCNSDNLFFDEYIPPLDSTIQLQVGHIYFVLPLDRLQYPLTAREMAAMAVKASIALAEGSKKNKSRRRKRTQKISPLSDLGEKVLENEDEEKKTEIDDAMRSKSLKRVMSRKGRLVRPRQKRPFRATLTTIHEGFTAE